MLWKNKNYGKVCHSSIFYLMAMKQTFVEFKILWLPVQKIVERFAFALVASNQAFVQQRLAMEHESFDKLFAHFQLKLVLELEQFVALLEIEQLVVVVLEHFDLKFMKKQINYFASFILFRFCCVDKSLAKLFKLKHVLKWYKYVVELTFTKLVVKAFLYIHKYSHYSIQLKYLKWLNWLDGWQKKKTIIKRNKIEENSDLRHTYRLSNTKTNELHIWIKKNIYKKTFKIINKEYRRRKIERTKKWFSPFTKCETTLPAPSTLIFCKFVAFSKPFAAATDVGIWIFVPGIVIVCCWLLCVCCCVFWCDWACCWLFWCDCACCCLIDFESLRMFLFSLRREHRISSSKSNTQ